MASDTLGGLSDSALLDVADQVITAMTPDPAVYFSTAAVVASLTATKNEFSADLTAHVAAQAAAKAATATKQAARETLEAAIRSIRNIAKAGGTKEAAMADLGIPSGSSAAPSNATVPAGAVNTSERLRHTLSWTDAAALDNRKKPRGVMGCEIWLKLGGTPPIDENECVFLTLDAYTPYLAEYAGTDAGKMAHYMLRWRFRDGSVSAWGETISATITG
ncbi:MAG: hypothetical protein LC113_13475 [Acidobacteria bacterium]|nr:hypothetical protein [Acidobacteriota bacterium]